MYAVIKTGGKQYRVGVGQTVRVERLEGNIGDVVTLDDVLAVSDGEKMKIGQSLLSEAKVTAKIVEQHRAKKIIVFKKKRRKNYHRTRGHRQYYTALQIQEISA
ncbi:MAG: 50S ribosomal protein L21 [Deltaproteobacteria bacterium]|nr:50S ribosomal protein L21 [Deltaproteobacteria bacterium]MBW2141257.1 50S ribosomal protein L21 [Deltaproteobacteria bacterium]